MVDVERCVLASGQVHRLTEQIACTRTSAPQCPANFISRDCRPPTSPRRNVSNC